jgi:SulP family sulfate permease
MLKPKLFDTLKNYTLQQFSKDLLAGLIVGLVALPLAIAFAVASGVTPEKGLYTAIVAGFIISVLGGSRVQIGGPTGAFIVIVYGIVQNYGINGLIVATLLGGLIIMVMGFARLGSVIKFIPYPLIVGFTSGIALIIFSSQMKDFFGMQMGAVPADFIGKWSAYFQHFQLIDRNTTLIGIATVFIIVLWPKITTKIPGSLIAIIITTFVVHIWKLPVETIGSKFGGIPTSLPKPSIPHLDFLTIKNLIQPAFTIALLGSIESLLSAVVSDGMIGGNHRSNMELVAQGIANVGSALFGGIPATGAIARTATNVKNGGRTPIAGIIHAFTLFFILIVFSKWAGLIPMATLGGVLIVVAYHMSEWENFVSIVKGPRSDIAILLITFALTVLVDLTVAIEVGIVLSAFLFMRQMIKLTYVSNLKNVGEWNDENESLNNNIPDHVEVFEIRGPLFFGAAYKFKEIMQLIDKHPKVLIIRMRNVPMIDATGIKTLREVHKDAKQNGSGFILSEVNSEQVMKELKDARLLFAIGKGNVTATFEAAIQKSKLILEGV